MAQSSTMAAGSHVTDPDLNGPVVVVPIPIVGEDSSSPSRDDSLVSVFDDATTEARMEARRRQEALWANAVVDARTHFSDREVIALHSKALRNTINTYHVASYLAKGSTQEECVLSKLPLPLLRRVAELGLGRGHGAVVSLASELGKEGPTVHKQNYQAQTSFRIVVRKRPLLEREVGAGSFDSVTCDASHRAVTLHSGKLMRSGRRLTMTHSQFHLDEVFDSCVSDDTVCKGVVDPLLEHVLYNCSKEGENEAMPSATMVAFGQTGSGKTRVLRAAIKHLAKTLKNFQVVVTFFEVHGRRCLDLLSDRKEVFLRADAKGDVHVRGAVELCIGADGDSSESLESALDAALNLRASAATERNSASSRSHAVCTLRIVRRCDKCDKGEEGGGGVLTLVDLAGSERNYETTQMDAAEHRVSADINKSLMALKDCFRAHAARHMRSQCTELGADKSVPHAAFRSSSKLLRNAPSQPPYRASSLTRVLRQCFEAHGVHRTVVVACVSPAAADVEHSLNTLRHVVLMSPLLEMMSGRHACVDVPMMGKLQDAMSGSSSDTAWQVTPVDQWTSEHVRSWIAHVDDGRFANLALPRNVDGKMLLSIPARGFMALFAESERHARGAGEGASWTVDLAARADAEGHSHLNDAHNDDVEWVDLFSSPPNDDDVDDEDDATPSEETQVARAEAIGRALYNSLRKEHIRQMLSASQSSRAVRSSSERA